MKRIDSAEVQPHEIEHNAKVRKYAGECSLFLKRNCDFPTSPCTVNLYGNGARRTLKGGKGSGDVNTRYTVSVEQGLLNAGFEISTTVWLDEYDKIFEKAKADFWRALEVEAAEKNTLPYVLIMDHTMPTVEYGMPLDGNGDVDIYVIARETSEGMDRKNIKGDYILSDSEVRDIKNLVRSGKRFLLVLNVCGVVDLSPVIDIVDNILLLGMLGAETGNVFADIITGRVNPSGKLAATWAKRLADYPSTIGFGDRDDVYYADGIYVGYRYFDSFNVKPQFAFGYGLSYTDFALDPKSYAVNGNTVTVFVAVANIGRFKGKEVIQAYYSHIGDGDRPHKQLAAFAKTKELATGKSCVCELSFDMAKLAVFDAAVGAYVLQSGEYVIDIGNSSDNTVCALCLRVKTDTIIKRVCKLYDVAPGEIKPTSLPKKREPILGCVDFEFVPTGNAEKQVRKDHTGGLDDGTLVKLCVGVKNDMTLNNVIGSSGKIVAGSAGETYSDDNIPPIVFADGPAGLRLSVEYKLDEKGNVCESSNALGGMLPIDERKEQPNGKRYYQYCTAIPVGTALAQSFNPELCTVMGDIVGKEMELFGVDVWLAPALNIQRNPLCGRNFEYYSEDPLVSGIIAAAVVNGVRQNKGRYACIKHFCCNNQETNRFYNNSIVGERALREIYLKGFEICLEKSDPATLMTSYNLVNGEHTANSKELVKTVLRGEWGYNGLVMTDWMVTGGFGNGFKYGAASASGCIAASNDLIMPGRDEDEKSIVAALNDGKITRGELSDSANRVLRLAYDKK